MFANRRVHLAQSKHARFFGHHVRLNVFHTGTVQDETLFQNRFCFRVTVGSCQTIAQTQISHCNNNNIKKGKAVTSAVGSSETLGQNLYSYYFEFESNDESSYSKNDSEWRWWVVIVINERYVISCKKLNYFCDNISM